MDADTQVTLDQVHDAILASVRAQFPALATVEAYSLDRDHLQTPACLVEMTDMEASGYDPGTGQLEVVATFEAQLLMSFRQPGMNPKREIRKLAGAFAVFARLQRWGVPVGPAEVVGAYPDDFDPELDKYEVWRVEWRQIIHLGESVWKADSEGVTPSMVMASWAPQIGAEHEGVYERLNDAPPTDTLNETTLVLS